MSAGFGFSFGDFVTALGLVRDIIEALQDSGTARVEYRQLLRQLYSLETALQHVSRLELDEVEEIDGVDRSSEVAALREAAGQCQRSIDDFFKRIQHYIPHLSEGRASSAGSKWKGALRKVQWAVCHKSDISKLQADLVGHTQSIEVLLAAIQMKGTTIQSRAQESRHQSLTSRIQESYFGCMRTLTVITGTVNNGVQQGKRLLEMTTQIIDINIRIFQTVLSIHHQLLRIPGQVERQQPVFLIDAIGRECPFHLEFVRSAKALTSVLELNFEKIGQGKEKIRSNEFAIEDTATKRDIDLTDEWETCFQPGQNVHMSMIFDRPLNSSNYCPRCRTECAGNVDGEAQCLKCEIKFRQVTEMEDYDLMPEVETTNASDIGPVLPPLRILKRHRDLADEELAPFRKVRIRSWVPLQLAADIKNPQDDNDRGVSPWVCSKCGNENNLETFECMGCDHILCHLCVRVGCSSETQESHRIREQLSTEVLRCGHLDCVGLKFRLLSDRNRHMNEVHPHFFRESAPDVLPLGIGDSRPK